MFYKVVEVYSDDVVTINHNHYLRVDYKVPNDEEIYSYIIHMGLSTEYNKEWVSEVMNSRLFIANVPKSSLGIRDYRFDGKHNLIDSRHSIVSAIEHFVRELNQCSLAKDDYLLSCLGCCLTFKGSRADFVSLECLNNVNPEVGKNTVLYGKPLCPGLALEKEGLPDVLLELSRYGFTPASEIYFYVVGGFLVYIEVR